MARQVIRALVIPQLEGEHAPLPQPAQVLDSRVRVAAEPGQGVPAQRNGRGVVLGERDEGVKQHAARRGHPIRRARRGTDSPGYLGGTDTLVQPGCELGSREGVQVGLARELEIQRLELLRRGQHQQRGFPAPAGRESELRANQVDLGALHLVERPLPGDRDQGPGRLEGARLDVREGGGQRPPGSRPGFRRQLGCAGQEGGGGSESGPGLGPAG